MIGAGYIAVELAGVFTGLGTDTTLVLRKEKAMTPLDSMLRDELDAALLRQGMKILRKFSAVVSVNQSCFQNTLSHEARLAASSYHARGARCRSAQAGHEDSENFFRGGE